MNTIDGSYGNIASIAEKKTCQVGQSFSSRRRINPGAKQKKLSYRLHDDYLRIKYRVSTSGDSSEENFTTCRHPVNTSSHGSTFLAFRMVMAAAFRLLLPGVKVIAPGKKKRPR
jgi:hypothetical protein